MSDLSRYLGLALFSGFQAMVLTLGTIGLSKLFPQFAQKLNFNDQKNSPLKILKYITLFIGQCFGVWHFWNGFGIAMGSGINDSPWVMTYVYFCIWPIIPVVMISFLLPWLRGFALIGNAFWSYYLINNIWLSKISFVSKDEIFIVHNGVYSFWLTIFTISGPMILLGLAFLFINWKKRIVSKEAVT